MTTREKIKDLEKINEMERNLVEEYLTKVQSIRDNLYQLQREGSLFKKNDILVLTAEESRYSKLIYQMVEVYDFRREEIQKLKSQPEYPKLVMVNATTVDLAINDNERIVLFKVKKCNCNQCKIGSFFLSVHGIGVGNDYQEEIILDNQTLNLNNQ